MIVENGEYKILRAISFEDMLDKVRVAVKDGWKPMGSAVGDIDEFGALSGYLYLKCKKIHND